jgi:hypothetical protein
MVPKGRGRARARLGFERKSALLAWMASSRCMWTPGSIVGEIAVRAVDQLVSVEIVFRNIDADRAVVLVVIRVVPTGIRAGHQEKTSAIQL